MTLCLPPQSSMRLFASARASPLIGSSPRGDSLPRVAPTTCASSPVNTS